MPAFRLQAKKLFLTYPQCSLDKQVALDQLKEKLPTWAYIVVCSELHQDGSPHLHAFVECNTKVRLNGANCLDILGHHGKYEGAESRDHSIRYVKKDGDFIEEGEIPQGKESKWTKLGTVTSAKEFMATALEISPRDYYLNMERLQYAANHIFKPTLPPYVPDHVFESIPPAVQQWLDQIDTVRPKSLILWGPTRTGKTELARSLGPHVYHQGIFNLDDHFDTAKYAVFDDWTDWSKFYQYKCWIGSQKQFAVTDKYCKKRTIRWGKPAIIVSNYYPNFPDDAWIRGNTIILHVVGPLF